jgi:hypothetical protein
MRPEDLYLPQYAAIFQVHRVWKGKVPKEFTVYFVPNGDGPSFRKGQRGVEVANPQTERHGDNPAVPLRSVWVGPCEGLPQTNETLKQLGPSHKPSS